MHGCVAQRACAPLSAAAKMSVSPAARARRPFLCMAVAVKGVATIAVLQMRPPIIYHTVSVHNLACMHQDFRPRILCSDKGHEEVKNGLLNKERMDCQGYATITFGGHRCCVGWVEVVAMQCQKQQNPEDSGLRRAVKWMREMCVIRRRLSEELKDLPIYTHIIWSQMHSRSACYVLPHRHEYESRNLKVVDKVM